MLNVSDFDHINRNRQKASVKSDDHNCNEHIWLACTLDNTSDPIRREGLLMSDPQDCLQLNRPFVSEKSNNSVQENALRRTAIGVT